MHFRTRRLKVTGVSTLEALKLLPLALGIACGCARRAPAPEQCLHFAQRWYHVQARAPLGPASREVGIEELTLRCLTQPFEPEFVACVNRQGSLRACHSERYAHDLSAL